MQLKHDERELRATIKLLKRVPYTDGLEPAFPSSEKRNGYNVQQSDTWVIADTALTYVRAGRAVVMAYTVHGSIYTCGSTKLQRPSFPRRERAWLASQNLSHVSLSEQLLHTWIHFKDDWFQVLEKGEYYWSQPNRLVLVPSTFRDCFRVSPYDGMESPYLCEFAYLRQQMDKTLKHRGKWTRQDDERVRGDWERMVMWPIYAVA